ncbi:MAG: hypothetical protein IKS90_07270 [Clostridia bacterium]|nr:hypothetical protein [Clostridia bacterium]
MTLILLISAFSLIGLIALIFFKPSVLYRGRSINIYWLAPLLGACALLLVGSVSPKTVFTELTRDSGMNPIKILVLLISMTVISIYLDNAGFFGYIAAKVVGLAGSSEKKLFLILYLIVSVLTFFTSNDIIVLTFTPFICYFSRSAKIDPIPFLVCEFVAANTWSMALIIGNPTNIYLASNAGISFFEYLKTMLLPTLASGAVSLFVMFLIFRRQLEQKITTEKPSLKLENRFDVILALSHLFVCIVLMSISVYISIPMWLISFCACISLLTISFVRSLCAKTGFTLISSTLRRAPWDVIPFVLSMFVIVTALNASEFTERFAEFLLRKNPVYTYGLASFLSANLINNIPMSVLFSSVCENAVGASQVGALYASVIGSNIGAFFTPIGAIAGIMWMSLLKLQRVKFSYVDFIKYGAPISVAAIGASLAVLDIII